MGKPEGAVEHYLMNRCRELGYLCIKFTAESGVPDRIVIGSGQTVFVELKAPGKVPPVHQIAKHEEMRKAGATVIVLDTKYKIDRFLLKLTQHQLRPDDFVIRPKTERTAS